MYETRLVSLSVSGVPIRATPWRAIGKLMSVPVPPLPGTGSTLFEVRALDTAGNKAPAGTPKPPALTTFLSGNKSGAPVVAAALAVASGRRAFDRSEPHARTSHARPRIRRGRPAKEVRCFIGSSEDAVVALSVHVLALATPSLREIEAADLAAVPCLAGGRRGARGRATPERYLLKARPRDRDPANRPSPMPRVRTAKADPSRGLEDGAETASTRPVSWSRVTDTSASDTRATPRASTDTA